MQARSEIDMSTTKQNCIYRADSNGQLKLLVTQVIITCHVVSALIGSAHAEQGSGSAWLEGRIGHLRAIELQEQSSQPILLEVSTRYCAPCRVIHRELLSLKEFLSATSDVIKVRIDASDSRYERTLAERLKVTCYPTYLWLNAERKQPTSISFSMTKGDSWAVYSLARALRTIEHYKSNTKQ